MSSQEKNNLEKESDEINLMDMSDNKESDKIEHKSKTMK